MPGRYAHIMFTKTLPEHVDTVAARMRAADVAEVAASSGYVPREALLMSLDKSDRAFTVMVHDQPEAIFGVASLNVLAGTAAPWMLGTDAVTVHYRAALRLSRLMLPGLARGYSVLRNIVHADNRVSVAWLRWLGFDLSEPLPLGRGGALFHVFEKDFGHV
jgi:hypothetical protein